MFVTLINFRRIFFEKYYHQYEDFQLKRYISVKIA